MHRLRPAGLCSLLCSFVLFSIVCSKALAQDSCGAPFQVMKQQKVASINMPGVNNIHGYIAGFPDDYASTTTKYPLFIFFHGLGEQGTGSSNDLCKLLSNEWWWAPPVIRERTSGSVFPASVTAPNGGGTFKFILISPQVNGFSDASGNINAFITYLSNQYRVDTTMIYITGLSAGADYIQSYAGANDYNAKRIAGVLPVAVCSNLTSSEANVIARNNLAFWATKCSYDGTCAGATTASGNANLVNAQSPATSVPAFSTTFPIPGWDCNSGLSHDVWGNTYRVDFKQMVNGANVNIYEWMVSHNRASATLPVKLESYSVQLRNENVYVQWATSAESNNAKYTIERSADGKKFTEIASIPAAGNTTGKSYQWIDENPLVSLSYYRLVQTDLDGRKEIFQVKKILNTVLTDRTLIISKNPFSTELSAFINVAHTQPVTVTLADINGRIVTTQYAKYAAGMAEINISTSSLPKGVYFLKVKGEDFVQTQKVVKQ